MFTYNNMKNRIKSLIDKGVCIPCPETVELSDDVDLDRISKHNVTIHAGTRISGSKTLIMSGVEIGHESPVMIHNCQIGRNSRLSGGVFYNSCLLEGVVMGANAHVRDGCLLEEHSRTAHTVGLKQTILFPFVTLGSLINFCDCLMAGGTDKRNHSEVGSSYIHFNYTPNQDKATASLIGDVPKGVMLNQRPIFLGGQGGIAGPVSVAYGTVVAAGTILRKDIRKENHIVFDYPNVSMKIPFFPGLYRNINRIIKMNVTYISNLIALRRWYRDVRSVFAAKDPEEKELITGGTEKIEMAIDERIKRIKEVADRMPSSISIYKKNGGTSRNTINQQNRFAEKYPAMEKAIREGIHLKGNPSLMNPFLDKIKHLAEKKTDYLAAIKELDNEESELGTKWLQELVYDLTKRVTGIL
jgi:UDP-N-acetylglucosamine/UDP-N-acetylgalactosamine diphosphorylase